MSTKNEKLFMENVEKFRQYVEEKHELPVATTEYEGFKLGQWISNQKNFFEKWHPFRRKISLIK